MRELAGFLGEGAAVAAPRAAEVGEPAFVWPLQQVLFDGAADGYKFYLHFNEGFN